MKILQRILPYIYPLAFVFLAIYRLVVLNSEVLFEAQEQGYWQPGREFWDACLLEEGGVFSWLGAYLTQYFYYPALGASLLITFWVVIYVLLYKALGLNWKWGWIALCPPLLLLWAETSLGYAIYAQVVRDWWFTPTLFVLVMSVIALIGVGLPKYFRQGWVVLVVLVALGVATPWVEATRMPLSVFRPFHAMAGDDNYHRELRMMHAAEKSRWAEVVKVYDMAEENPTRTMWLIKNIALFNRDRLHLDLLSSKTEIQTPAISDSIFVPHSLSIAPLMYYLHGCIGFSYRWAMENNVEFGISMQRLRVMARCALVKGEWELADKYLTHLENTTFQSKWAREQRKFLGNPALLSSDPHYRVPVALSRVFDDILDGDNGDVETYLTTLYGRYSGKEHSDALDKLIMNYAIQSRDIPTFWRQFSVFASRHAGEQMPKVYQELACLYGQLAPDVYDASKLPFSEDVLKSCYRFLSQYSLMSQQGASKQQIAQSTKREFGHTAYWFYYFNQ